METHAYPAAGTIIRDRVLCKSETLTHLLST
jgi:hypothetical protein